MTRSFKGSSLACVFMALIAVKHAALGFCLCNQEFFLSNCGCEAPASHEDCSDCGGCPLEPCDSCEVPVPIDVADFIWSADQLDPKAPAFPATLHPGPRSETLRDACAVPAASAIRGSPPGTRRPLFLLTSTLRL